MIWCQRDHEFDFYFGHGVGSEVPGVMFPNFLLVNSSHKDVAVTLLLHFGSRAYLFSAEEGSCYVFSTRNNSCEFLAFYGVITQSVIQSGKSRVESLSRLLWLRSQSSVENANQNVGHMLTTWMQGNQSTSWNHGLKFIQFTKYWFLHSDI